MQPATRNRLRQGVMTGVIVALALLVAWQLQLFAQIRLSTSNLFFVEKPVSDTVAIIALDDASLQEFGRSPAEWSRSVYADLTTRLSEAGARVIAFDLLFSEPSADDAAFADAIRIARTEGNRTRFVMATAGVTPAIPPSDSSYPFALAYLNSLHPVEQLSDVDYTGITNTTPDVDAAIRRQPSVVYIGDDVRYSFSLAAYLAYLRVPASAAGQLIVTDEDALTIANNRRLPVDTRGLWRQNYFGAPRTTTSATFPTFSAVDVINGEIDSAQFADKIVLVGLAGSIGATDQYPVPASLDGRLMAGVEIQANAIETIIQDAALSEPAPLAEAATIALIAIISGAALALPRWTIKLILAVIGGIAWWVFAFVVFNSSQLVLNLFHPTLAIALPALFLIGLEINREIQLRRRSDFLLESVTQVSEQRMSLPDIFGLIANDLQQIVPESSGSIWLRDDNSDSLHMEQTWGTTPPFVDRDTLLTANHPPNRHVEPVIWQGHTLAAFDVRTGQPRLGDRERRLIADLARQLAPSLDNALLYREIQRQNNTLETILVNSPAAITLLDKSLTILQHNAIFAAIFSGTSNQSEVQRNFIDVLKTCDVTGETLAEVERKFGNEFYFRVEIGVGAHTYIMDAAMLIPFEMWVLVFNDVTSLVDLNKLKTRMIRMASHDLKNPLARVMMYSQLVERTADLNDKSAGYIRNIYVSAEEMSELIKDILDLEQLQSGKLNLEPIDFKRVIEAVSLRQEGDAEQKEQQFTRDLPPAPVMVLGDERQLSQVLQNLIGNAIKYTPTGGQITVRLFRKGRVARFEVQDTGYGISPEAQARLFTEFYRVRTAATADIAGTGLGLSLVKSIIEGHNGTVGVNSKEGVGSTFYVELPLAATGTLESD